MRLNSIVHSDEWAAYGELSQKNNYSHGTLAQKYHFVDSSAVHTQHVKILNNKIKL